VAPAIRDVAGTAHAPSGPAFGAPAPVAASGPAGTGQEEEDEFDSVMSFGVAAASLALAAPAPVAASGFALDAPAPVAASGFAFGALASGAAPVAPKPAYSNSFAKAAAD
jgi:hypothetical protein